MGDAPRYRIGVDLGGTKIEALALDPSGAEVLRRRVATPRGDYEATIRTVAALVTELEASLGASASVGIGTPGSRSPTSGRWRNSNSIVLNGEAIDRDLEAALKRPVRIANDADCFALSEATDGAGAGARVLFGVILGTGVGGGIVVDGCLLGGPNAIAGEWGHNPLPTATVDELEGPRCYCGRAGCIETWLSGPGLSADHRRVTGFELAPEGIVEAANAGEPTARATLERYADRLARSLGGVINLLDPDVIVLGGGLSNVEWIYQRVPELWSRFVFSDVVDTRLVANRHGDSSGVRGAAWLWPADCGGR
ncbi:MAG: ROK family protein [Myxococcales bacterium]|nr:ROK family protein [Myxococcales bacterium]